MRSTTRNRALGNAAAAGALVLLYFLLLTHPGLKTGFTGDDVMNISFLHGYGRVSPGVVLAQALSIFTPEYRPMGGLYYLDPAHSGLPRGRQTPC